MAIETLYAVGNVPQLVLRRKDNGRVVDFSHINSAKSDITKELFQAKAQGIPMVSFLKPATGKLNLTAEVTSDYIRKEVYDLGLIPKGAGNGVVLFKSLDLVTDDTGVTKPLTDEQIPVKGLKVFSQDRMVEYKEVATGTPAKDEFIFDATAKTIKLGGATKATSIWVDGYVKAEDKQQMSYFGNTKPIMFEAYLYVLKTGSDGIVTMDTYVFPSVTPATNMNIEASPDNVTAFDMEFDVLAEKRLVNGKYEFVMVDIISDVAE